MTNLTEHILELKPVVYVAGAYRHERGEYYVRMNIREAENVALEIWRSGAVAICPHKNTAGFGGAYGLTDEIWLNGDKILLSLCDAIYLVPNYISSKGAMEEYELAKLLRLPVITNLRELLDFLKEWKDRNL